MIKDSAAILFYNKKKEILMMQRTLDAKHNPGCWSFFGGGMKKGETPLQAVKREAKEELRINLTKPRFLLTVIYDNPSFTDRMHMFAQEFPKDVNDRELEQKEGCARGWYSINDALKINLSPNVRAAFKELAKIWPD